LVRTGLVSILLVAIPVFGVLIWLGRSNGSWIIAVVGALASLMLCLIAYILFRLTFIGVTAKTIEERGYWGTRTSVPRADVTSVVLAQIYTTASPDPISQLIVRDVAGERMLRMRGSFWTIEAMQAAIAAIDIAPVTPSGAMSSSQFFAHYPGAAYWYERHPVAAIVILVAGLAVVTAAVLTILQLAGVPLIGH
jgi:hypothetical protein